MLKYTQQVKEKHVVLFFIVSLLAAFLLRLLTFSIIEGYPNDIACLKGWAIAAAQNGLPDFYLGDGFIDYPPVYIYVLYIIGLIKNFFLIDYYSDLFLLLIKFPAILADIATSMLIFLLARKKIAAVGAAAFSLLYAFNPSIVINSTFYGQIDSLLALYILLMLVLLQKDRLVYATIVFVVSSLTKYQFMIFAPLIILVLLDKIVVDTKSTVNNKKFKPSQLVELLKKEGNRTLLLSVLFGILTFVVILIPFSIKQQPLWIFAFIAKSLSSYPYASCNAFNIFTLFGANWLPASESFLFLPYRVWGSIFIVLITGISAYLYFSSEDKSKIHLLALFISMSVFMLSHKMHERYLFPAVVLVIMAYINTKDKRFLFIFAAVSITFFFNQALVLYFVLRPERIYHISNRNVWLRIISLANIVIWIYSMRLIFDTLLKKTKKE